MNMILYLPRQLRGPIACGTAFSSLGLAIFAGSALTSSAAGPPRHTQAVAQILAMQPEVDDEDAAGIDAIDDDDEPAGKVRLSRDAVDDDNDDDDEPTGKVRITRETPPEARQFSSGTAPFKAVPRARRSISDLLSIRRSPKASDLRKSPPRSRLVSPIAQPSAPGSALPPPVFRMDDTVSDDPGTSAAKVQTAPQLSERPYSLEDESDDVDDVLENESPPSMLLEQEAAAVDPAAVSASEVPAFISLSDNAPVDSSNAADECPPAERKVKDLVDRILADEMDYKARKPQMSETDDLPICKPMSKLRADMQMRLPNKHSILWEKPNDESHEGELESTRKRVQKHEEVRCQVEAERLAIRKQFAAAYGPYVDRGFGSGCDENVAPLFPYTYYPLYFEDPNLERCGYSLGCCTQPFVSGALFYGDVALLPLKMLVLCPWECVYPQEDCEPCTRYGYCDNVLGPCPETTGWGCFRSRRYSCKSCKSRSW